jgi:tetratricopeptide (TPR) repeat protein
MKRLSGSISIPLIIFVVSVTVFGCPSMLYGQETPGEKNARETGSKDSLIPVPNPLLVHLEKAVSQQLHEKRQKVDALAKKPGVNRQQLAQAYGELGQLYHAYELTEAAEACYRNALILDPSNLEWQYSLGYLLQSLGRFSEALDLYQRVETGGQNPRLAYLVHIRSGECYRSLNQPDQAKRSIETAFRINPEGPAVLARLGEVALAEKRYQDAIKYLVSALKKQPDANSLHYPLGMAYRGTGDMEKARYHLSKRGMVGVQPPDPLKTRLEKLVTGHWTHILAGRLAFSAGRYTEAVESFQKAIKADPGAPGARVNLGTALVQLKQYRQAITQFQAAIQLAPDNAAAHFNLGMMYGSFGNYRKAIEHLQVVVEKNPKDSGAHLALANAFRVEQRLGKAIEHYKAALGLDPGLTWAWVDMSTSLSSIGQHAEALRVLEEAYSRMPHIGPIAHALAHLLAASPDLDKRQGDRALDLAMKVFKAVKNYEHARTVAIAYAELNKCSKAVEWMETAIELAANSNQPSTVLEVLKRNLVYFKTQRPCRIPAKQ